MGTYKCTLALREPEYRNVAEGKLFNDGLPLHNSPVPEGFVKVVIHYVYEDEMDILLPVPILNSEVDTLSTAISTWVWWPHDLVGNIMVEPQGNKAKAKARSSQP